MAQWSWDACLLGRRLLLVVRRPAARAMAADSDRMEAALQAEDSDEKLEFVLTPDSTAGTARSELTEFEAGVPTADDDELDEETESVLSVDVDNSSITSHSTP
eukprot:jgi/Chlat1/6743/Chrsp50S06479